MEPQTSAYIDVCVCVCVSAYIDIFLTQSIHQFFHNQFFHNQSIFLQSINFWHNQVYTQLELSWVVIEIPWIIIMLILLALNSPRTSRWRHCFCFFAVVICLALRMYLASCHLVNVLEIHIRPGGATVLESRRVWAGRPTGQVTPPKLDAFLEFFYSPPSVSVQL